MPIEDRNLTPGTKLEARYHGKVHTCEVVKTKEGIRYRLPGNDKEFKSPSAAGSAVMGTACNGWRFWSLAGELKERAPKAAKMTKAEQVITPLDDNRMFCSACQEAFAATGTDIMMVRCPKGHANGKPVVADKPKAKRAARPKGEPRGSARASRAKRAKATA